MDFVIRMSEKNETQVVLTYLGGLASSDVAKEYILFFFALINASIFAAVIYQFILMVRDKYSILEAQRAVLAILMGPIFIFLLIFLSHHISGWPNIHRSSYSILEIGDNTWNTILWTFYLIVTTIEHKIQKIGMRWILIGSLSPFFVNVMIFITHRLLGIPSIIY